MAKDFADIRPLIHIGYHKTGTTWLQEYLFMDARIGFVSPTPKHRMARRHLVLHLINPHPLEFDGATCGHKLAKRWLPVSEPEQCMAISFERLCGHPDLGSGDSKEIADRLKCVFPGGRVLIVIRKQQSALLSTYGQYVKEMGVWSLGEYLQPPVISPRFLPFCFRLVHFQYHRLICYYLQLFGRENVLVLTFEHFRQNPAEFVTAIVDFCGLPVDTALIGQLPYRHTANPSLSGISLEIKRRLNQIIGRKTPQNVWVIWRRDYGTSSKIKRTLLKIDRLLPETLKQSVDRRMRQQIADRVGDYYAESNRMTAELTGLDLAAYGYQMSKAPHPLLHDLQPHDPQPHDGK